MGKTEKYDHMKLIRQYAGGHKNLITLGRAPFKPEKFARGIEHMMRQKV